MRNHSHSKRNRLARMGGCVRPSPGRHPGGAKNMEMNPASSSMPSDWYPANSEAALTKERKQTKHTASIPRGQMFTVTSSAAIIPSQHKPSNRCELAENHNTVGAYQ